MAQLILSDLERESLKENIISHCRIDSYEEFRFEDHDPGWLGTDELKELGVESLKKSAKKLLKRNIEALSEAQELLYAGDQYSLLILFQAMDAAGKDGTIKHVTSGLNPQGCQVYSFKKPSDEELDHNFLWRNMTRLPEQGMIGIFNRSYYEEVLAVRVHPEFLEGQKLPNLQVNEEFWNARYEDINNFEKHLCRNGTLIIKFFLNVSKEEQKNRFMERLNNPEKHWKFSEADLEERGYWDDYMEAFRKAINATATEWAPWYVIPADNKWVMRTIVSQIITELILELDLQYPEVSEAKKARLAKAKIELENE